MLRSSTASRLLLGVMLTLCVCHCGVLGLYRYRRRNNVIRSNSGSPQSPGGLPQLRMEVRELAARVTALENGGGTSGDPVGFTASLSASEVLTSTNQFLSLDVETSDVGNNYDPTTGLFTAPTDGLYYVFFICGTATISPCVLKDGAGTEISEVQTPTNSGLSYAADVLQLSQGDTVGVGFSPVGASTQTSVETAKFSVFKIQG